MVATRHRAAEVEAVAEPAEQAGEAGELQEAGEEAAGEAHRGVDREVAAEEPAHLLRVPENQADAANCPEKGKTENRKWAIARSKKDERPLRAALCNIYPAVGVCNR